MGNNCESASCCLTEKMGELMSNPKNETNTTSKNRTQIFKSNELERKDININENPPRRQSLMNECGQIDKEATERAKAENVTQYQTIHFENRSVYQGELKDNTIRHGYGTQTWPDGSRYVGQWFNDKAHGFGEIKHTDGDIYRGDWEDDKANGEGTYIHANGTIYIGRWQGDKQHGYGVEEWPDGAKCVDLFIF